jgi:hypothetical protein
MSENPEVVDGLVLPRLLVGLIRQGRWRHPGDEALRELIPFLREPIDFTDSHFESPLYLAELDCAEFCRIARGSQRPEASDLPWLDAEKAVFVAINRYPGDDLAIALDYRTDADDPRVVAGDWQRGRGGCLWREVAATFSAFVAALGLTGADG